LQHAETGGILVRKPRHYALTLDAKSKKKDGANLKAKDFGVETIARYRDEAQCEHAMLAAPAFEHTLGKESALSKDIKKDRDNTAATGKPRTITAIHIDDLARLVQLRPVKRLGLARIAIYWKCVDYRKTVKSGWTRQRKKPSLPRHMKRSSTLSTSSNRNTRFDAALSNWPDQHFTLRQGIMFIREHPPTLGKWG
jgi:hypothetical protein